jgi:hypothetical protein
VPVSFGSPPSNALAKHGAASAKDSKDSKEATSRRRMAKRNLPIQYTENIERKRTRQRDQEAWVATSTTVLLKVVALALGLDKVPQALKSI